LFKEVVVIEAHYKAWWGTLLWATHGFCMDVLLTLSDEQHMVIFEEDAFVFDKELFYNWFDKLKDVHVVCGMNRVTPNNCDVFEKLNLFSCVPDVPGPGKESVLFIDKSIKQHWDWMSVDYFKLEKDINFKPQLISMSLNFKREVSFDTFEFFSLMCYLNPNIKLHFYEENSFDYWWFEGTNNVDEFYKKHGDLDKYVHYFNSALFQYLEFNDKLNKKIYYNRIMSSKDWSPFVHHLSTYTLGLALLKIFKKKYIELLGAEQYIKHRSSLKNYIYLLIQYYGYGRIKLEFNFSRFIKFTHRYVQKHHTLN
tara:strand:+ start:750 stop:1679 length:930 start_codon:yes stop_codon:yes gene_type:complete